MAQLISEPKVRDYDNKGTTYGGPGGPPVSIPHKPMGMHAPAPPMMGGMMYGAPPQSYNRMVLYIIMVLFI